MIVIKGAMPKSCGSCPMRSERWCNSLHKNVLYTFERLPDCPIVGEIPDKHGDLIDRDEIKLKHDPLYHWFTTAEMLKEEPTIVEASTEGEASK